jgi:hypothetical protein
VRHAGIDLIDGDLTVAPGQDVDDVVASVTDRPTEFTGTLTDAEQRAAPGYPVVVFSADRRYWRPGSRRVTVVRPSTDGTFRLVGLPPGSYKVSAVVDLDPSDLDDAAFLDALVPVSLTVTLTDGVKTVQNLRLAGASR